MEKLNLVHIATHNGLLLGSIISDGGNFCQNPAEAPCPSCGSTRQNLVKLPGWCANDTLRCGGCDLFLGLTPKPKTQRARRSGRGGASW